MVWDVSGLVVGAGWGWGPSYPGADTVPNGQLAVARYNSNEGSNATPTEYRTIGSGFSSYSLIRVGGGYLMYRWDSARMNLDWASSDFSVFQQSGRNSLGVNQLFNLVGNGASNALAVTSSNILFRWEVGDTSLTLPSVDPDTGGTGDVSVGWSGHNWLCITGSSNILRTSYSVLDDASAWTRGPRVILPSSISSTGSNGGFQNIFYMGDGWWVGYYLDSIDAKLRVYRFRYGNYAGNCPLGWDSVPPIS
jgi:hypothetical protein